MQYPYRGIENFVILCSLATAQVNNQFVSTFLTAGNIKLILLHGGRSEESIKNFFHEVHELYVKVCPMSGRKKNSS